MVRLNRLRSEHDIVIVMLVMVLIMVIGPKDGETCSLLMLGGRLGVLKLAKWMILDKLLMLMMLLELECCPTNRVHTHQVILSLVALKSQVTIQTYTTKQSNTLLATCTRRGFKNCWFLPTLALMGSDT